MDYMQKFLGTVAEFGEIVLTIILQNQGISAFSVGKANYPYDIIVPFKNGVFKNPPP